MKRCILAMLALTFVSPLFAQTAAGEKGNGSSASQPDSMGSASHNDSSDPKATPASPPQEAQKPAEDPDHPATIHFKGITITPGGFIEATGLYRGHNENADVGSTYANIPFDGTANANLSEFRFTARQSRLSVLAEGKVGDWKGSAYYEVDFLGAAPTANEVESNSFNLRQRQLWGQAESKSGFSFLAGQSFSLLTANRKGITPRQEFIPTTIDAQYVVGFNWARQTGFRLTQEIDHHVWLAIAIENPETVVNVTNPPSGIFGFNTSSNATSPSSLLTLNNTPGANGVSTDAAPDVVGKIAFEPGWGHFEVKGVARFFRDRINGSNNNKAGGGGGIAAFLPFGPHARLIVEGLAGSGIGRYASGLGPDLTTDPNGVPVPIKTVQGMAGLELTPDPSLDIYIYGGVERYDQSAFLSSAGKGVGYGSPLNDNSGCEVESPSMTQGCQAQNRLLWQFQPGFWYRFYNGPAGRMQMGLSYSYTHREAWSGNSGAFTPVAKESMVMLAFRFYIP
jgi:hypothetical protein